MANEKVYVGEIGAKELYRRIKRLINNFGGYEEATGTGDDNHPDVANPSTKIIYLVPVQDGSTPNLYEEWFWHVNETTHVGNWELFGKTTFTENSWKHWSEEHGSTSADSSSVYIGKNNTITAGADGNNYAFGESNSITFNDNTDYSTARVASLGHYNTATNAANAYQFGRDNSVSGNGLPDTEAIEATENTPASVLHHTLAVNIGRDNSIDGEGVNVGKFNTSTVGGSTFGQFNYATHGSTAVGEHCSSYIGSSTFGKQNIASIGSFAIGNGAAAYDGSIAFGDSALFAYSSSFAIGRGNGQSDIATRSEISGGSFAIIADTLTRWSSNAFAKSTISGQSFGIGSYNTVTGSSIGIGACNTVSDYSIALGMENQCTYSSFAVGTANNNIGYLDGSNPRGDGHAFGNNNHDVYGTALAVGLHNSYIHDMASAFGIRNVHVTDNSGALGHGNEWIDNCSFAVGVQNNNVNGSSHVLGLSNSFTTDSSIAIGNYNSYIQNGSAAIGIANKAYGGSVAIGIYNHSARGVFAMGIANSAEPEYIDHPTDYDNWQASFHGNAAIIGLGNKIKNVRESWHSGDMALNESRNTFSVAVGAYITAYGHNFIALGFGHTIGDPATWTDDTEMETDNDGFMTAIGYKCEAFRNFDMAIGYKSIAKGGENVAITNSKAIGYRNIAMINSDIIGISNVGLMESTLTTTIPVIENDEGKNVRNLLLHGNINHSGQDLIENIVINSGADLDVDSSCAGNIFYNVDRHKEPGYYDYNDVYHLYDSENTLSINAYCVVDNVFWGKHTGNEDGGSISCSGTVNKNFFINSLPNISNSGNVGNNFFLDAEVNVDHISETHNNTVLHGTIAGTNCYTKIIGNHIGIECSLKIDNCSEVSLVQNFLENGSSLTTYTENPIESGCNGSNNVMFGAFGTGIRSCFCMGQSATDSRNTTRQYTRQQFVDSITNMTSLNGYYNVTQSALATANFGPNQVMYASYSIVSGEGNTVFGTHDSTIIGKSNVVGYLGGDSSYYGYPSLGSGMFYANIFGEKNKVYAHNAAEFIMNTIHGGNNRVYADSMMESQIFGRENNISERPVITVMSSEQVKALQEQYESDQTIHLPSYIKLSNSGVIYDYYYYDWADVTNRNTTYVYEDNIYRISKVNKNDGTPCGINLEYAGYNESQIEPKPSDYATKIFRIHVFGQHNWIHSYIMDYTVFGSDNEITNSIAQLDPYDPFGISNGFVQGNNNVVSNGSNIVCMGNGNVSIGHNSVAIGSQLISGQWQTVVGKYNEAVAGPSRVIDKYDSDLPYDLGEVVWHEDGYYECIDPVQAYDLWDANKWKATNPESDKAIFIIGNGYSETDSSDWQDESKIHRSNAMEVYADGTVKARQFESDSDVTLAQGDGISITEANGQVTVSVKQSLSDLETFLTANPKPQTGTYMLGSVNGTWSWIQVNTTTIGA